MKKEIIINSTLNEVQIAITENGELAELFTEAPDKERLVGNVYIGTVQRIMQGMNATFVNIGLGQDAFLHFSDVDSSLEDSFITEDDEEDDEETPQEAATNVALRKKMKSSRGKKPMPTFRTKRSGTVGINLQPKQTVIVQVVREAYSSKGVRVTTKVALPGRYVVLMPFESMIGVSRKIQSVRERKRLRNLAKSILPPGLGCIIRTAAEDKTDVELRRDWDHLLEQWKEIERNVATARPPSLLYKDKNLAGSVIRDLFTQDVVRVALDSKKLYDETTEYLRWMSPELAEKVEYYTGKKSIFHHFRLDRAISDTFARKVMLPGGGSIVIDQTEALCVVDVNSGRALTEREQEKNAFIANMEAVHAVCMQLRLRDIGGMVIIDFIDMVEESNRKKIYDEMRRELNRDRAKTIIYPITQLGLMQMTRQRIRQNISERISDPCPTCNGVGRVPSQALLIGTLDRWLRNFKAQNYDFTIMLMVSPSLAEFLYEGSFSRISRLMLRHFIRIKVQQNSAMRPNEFRFISLQQHKDITQEYL